VDILLVDDHPILRFAVRELLGRTRPDLSIVGEVDTARDALPLLEAVRPDLVLMDILLPGPNGIVATREIRRAHPQCRVLIYTTLTEPVYAIEALAAGAAGYVLKNQGIDVLTAAIDTIAAGKRYLAPRIEKAVRSAESDGQAVGGLASLSVREKEVFDLVVGGHTNRRVASLLFISERTVETHRARINRKLGVHSTAELVRFAAQYQVIGA
jgi:DNA-binding NarL/FixJ family response regulator